MNSNEYKEFLVNCKDAIKENSVLTLENTSFDVLASDVFRNKEYVKQIAYIIRNKFINNIDDNLIAFDKNFSENGGEISWCIDYNNFLAKLDKILQKNKIKKVNIFNFNLSRELGIEPFIKNNDYISDSESNDCIIFSPQFGIINTGSLFLNFDSAYDMELVFSSKVKIFVLSLCDFLFKPEEVEIFSHLYSIYKDKVSFPYLTSVYTPSPVEKDELIYLFLVDNGRSNVLENKNIRSALTCISCGACKEVCPIYKIVGDKVYNNVFTGPIANVVLPFIENIESYKHLCFSCTSCGNCSAVCPMKIPVSELIISNKNYFFENKFMDMKDERFANNVKKYTLSRKKMNSKRWLKNFKIKYLSNSRIMEEYGFEKSTFNQQYTDKGNEK